MVLVLWNINFGGCHAWRPGRGGTRRKQSTHRRRVAGRRAGAAADVGAAGADAGVNIQKPEGRSAEILYENGGPAGRIAVPDAVLEALKAVLGSLAIEGAEFVADIPDFAAGGREDAPVRARDVRVERVEESFVAFETEGCACSFNNISAKEQAQIFCAIVGRTCGHARLTRFFYTLRAVEADYLRAVHLVDDVAACSGFFTRAAAHCGGGAALLHRAVLQVQPPLEVQPVDVALALATRGRAARGRGRLPAAVAGSGGGQSVRDAVNVCVRLARLVCGILAIL